jgi:hypothetical protein
VAVADEVTRAVSVVIETTAGVTSSIVINHFLLLYFPTGNANGGIVHVPGIL